MGGTAQKIQQHFTSEKYMQCTKAEEEALLKHKQTNGIELVINLSSCLKSAVANWRAKRVSQTKFNNLSKCIHLEIFLRGQLSTLY